MIALDKNDLQTLVILKRTQEWPRFMDILSRSISVLTIANATIKDEVQLRWNQGKVQELLDIIRQIKTSDEELHKFKTEARQHIE